MKTSLLRELRSSEGKGVIGCLLSIVMLAVAIYLGIVLFPIYYSNFNFENDVKTVASRAGAHFLDNQQITKDILSLAKKNEIRIKREDIKLERFAGQLHIRVDYSVPVDFIIMERDLNFEIEASSFIGTL
ncbi:MAG: DUF4845 domain-containing protein [Acidobacteriota bacterium]|jgi:hypothetical protein|nr:DUF4845 domain-containing protein [Acidobacteriota bacterium]